MTRRMEQMGEFLREEVTDIIRSELDDPRLGFWTITRVEVPSDLRSAKVYVSVLGDDEARKETITALRGAAGYIRSHLRPRMRTRTIPELDIREDRSMEHADQIGRTLRELQIEGVPLRSGGGSRSAASGGEGERGSDPGDLLRSLLPLSAAAPPSPPEAQPTPPPEEDA
ncbi:MAG: 30S ribosome-binding factor RbfA [Thermomicrobiales bacterium]